MEVTKNLPHKGFRGTVFPLGNVSVSSTCDYSVVWCWFGSLRKGVMPIQSQEGSMFIMQMYGCLDMDKGSTRFGCGNSDVNHMQSGERKHTSQISKYQYAFLETCNITSNPTQMLKPIIGLIDCVSKDSTALHTSWWLN